MNITLIIPSYNNLKHIKNAYTSIRKHYPEVNLILMDDGSTDGSENSVLNFKENFRDLSIHLINQKNQGVSVSRNHGVLRAKSKYIAFLIYSFVTL
jgi:glycosyltransferase involved in cell wall biosynthesis